MPESEIVKVQGMTGLADDLRLLDQPGRAFGADKRGSISDHLIPILSRIDLDADG